MPCSRICDSLFGLGAGLGGPLGGWMNDTWGWYAFALNGLRLTHDAPGDPRFFSR